MPDEMGKPVFTRKAAADLNDIWDYTYDTWSAEQANTYYNNLPADCSKVADKPENLGRHYDDVRPAVKGYPSGGITSRQSGFGPCRDL